MTFVTGCRGVAVAEQSTDCIDAAVVDDVDAVEHELVDENEFVVVVVVVAAAEHRYHYRSHSHHNTGADAPEYYDYAVVASYDARGVAAAVTAAAVVAEGGGVAAPWADAAEVVGVGEHGYSDTALHNTAAVVDGDDSAVADGGLQ